MNWKSFALTAAAVVAGLALVGVLALLFPRAKAAITSKIRPVG